MEWAMVENVRFSIAGICRDKKRQIQYGRNVSWSKRQIQHSQNVLWLKASDPGMAEMYCGQKRQI
jgi:hypothetical protein